MTSFSAGVDSAVPAAQREFCRPFFTLINAALTMFNFKCELSSSTVGQVGSALRTAAWKSAHHPTWVLANGRHDLNPESMPLWDLRKRLGSPRKPIQIRSEWEGKLP